VTTEQAIILALLAAAFVAGWLTHAVTEARTREETKPRPKTPHLRPEARVSLADGAVRRSRQELDRAVLAYQSAVVASVQNGNGGGSSKMSFERLAGALVGLVAALDRAAEELRTHHPLAEQLREAGLELKRLANAVRLHARDRELPTGICDQLEQHLLSAASSIFASSRLEPRLP
jgi:hypothetical protein